MQIKPVIQTLPDGRRSMSYVGPDGKRTLLTGANDEELLEKVANAHASSVSFAQRLQKEKLQTVKPATNEAATAAIKNASMAHASYSFLQKHLPGSENPFNNCQANIAAISDFIKQNDLEWSEASLEYAFETIGDSLAPSEAQHAQREWAAKQTEAETAAQIEAAERAELQAMVDLPYADLAKLFRHSVTGGDCKARFNELSKRYGVKNYGGRL
ncbi:MAG TPA: hypothetical protein VGD60_11470 [Candidatus Acidoferrales bacterium]